MSYSVTNPEFVNEDSFRVVTSLSEDSTNNTSSEKILDIIIKDNILTISDIAEQKGLSFD